jgi:hypothetical protein
MTDDTNPNKSVCGSCATLLVTLTPDGTATNVARQRLSLRCSLPAGHVGPHVDATHAEQWEAPVGATPTLLRHEED